MIQEHTLDKAICEAERFLAAAKKYRALASAPSGMGMKVTGRWSTVAEHASVKRASMDLSRMLADLRQGR